MRALETEYKGYLFRSRLEFRWALFFDALGIQWEYEPQGYALPSGWYLPDFFLPEINGGMWVEIKPNRPKKPNEKTTQLMGELVAYTDKVGVVLKGVPLEGAEDAIKNGDVIYDPPGNYDGSAYWLLCRRDFEAEKRLFGDEPDARDSYVGDGPYLFCACSYCGKVGFEFAGRGDRLCDTSNPMCSVFYDIKKFREWLRLPNKERAIKDCFPDAVKQKYNALDYNILLAAKTARTARQKRKENSHD